MYYPHICWRDWGKSRKTWVRVVGLRAEIRTRNLPNENQYLPNRSRSASRSAAVFGPSLRQGLQTRAVVVNTSQLETSVFEVAVALISSFDLCVRTESTWRYYPEDIVTAVRTSNLNPCLCLFSNQSYLSQLGAFTMPTCKVRMHSTVRIASSQTCLLYRMFRLKRNHSHNSICRIRWHQRKLFLFTEHLHNCKHCMTSYMCAVADISFVPVFY